MGKARTEASRSERKAKKRAAEDAIPDVPDSWTTNTEIEAESSKPTEKDSKKRKRDRDEAVSVVKDEKESKKKRRKRRKETDTSDTAVNHDALVEVKQEKKAKEKKPKGELVGTEVKDNFPGVLDTEMADTTVGDIPKRSKKERKAERKAKEAVEAAANSTAITNPSNAIDAAPKTNGATKNVGDKTEDGEEKKSKKNNRNREKKRKGANAAKATNGENIDQDASSKAARFIVFVGQLPFTATKESVEKHFASIKPKSVRVPTEKGQAGKAKGYAFVEFEGYDHMKTCLKLFHHSLFNDGISAAREINVNLTAGGGGNTKERKGKIEEKNHKLDEERIRRRQEEEKAKLTKRAEGVKKELIDESAIHPSRRGRVPVMK
ncbi:hypothetical protein BKA65DRAFT_607604 [Rhexocercosporidium sp. MPI-PUGE-AT-0058]|nr:hypothetical protein BKA65DRAFT_607604 [Rhexocercosporidium sp. MPI-PUGE-AT-0058]